MQTLTFDEVVERIVARDPRYHRDAYHFVRDALDFTQAIIHKELPKDAPDRDRHVTPRQLLMGIRDFGLKEFGPMAMTVFAEWGIHRTEDFGEIVFNRVDNGTELFSTTEKDSREDFKAIYDFSEAFQRPFLPAARRPAPPAEEVKPAEGGAEFNLKG